MKEAELRDKIARLQAQQRRQKLIEDLERPSRSKKGGFRFIHAFLIVLGIHVAALGGFFGLSALKKMNSSDKVAQSEKAPSTASIPDSSSKTESHSAVVETSNTPETGKTKHAALNPKKKKHQEVVASTPSVNKATSENGIPRKEQDSVQRSIQKITPQIKDLFTHHPSSSSISSPKSSGANAALANMGNDDSGGSAPLVATPLPKPANPSSYVVAPGDTLSKVASTMGMPASKIREANGLGSGNSLQVGQKLTIPAPETSRPPLELVQKEPEVNTEQPEKTEKFIPKPERIAPKGIYTVQSGDNPYSIAHRLGVSFTDLMMVNNITNPADVTIGMHLKVPTGALASN